MKKLKHLVLAAGLLATLNTLAQPTLDDLFHDYGSWPDGTNPRGMLYTDLYSSACDPHTTVWFLGGNNIFPPTYTYSPDEEIPAGVLHDYDIGTCNEFPFVLKAFDKKIVHITPEGKVGVGINNNAPNAILDVSAGSDHLKIHGDNAGSIEATGDMNLFHNGNFVVSQGNISSSSALFAAHSGGIDVYYGTDFNVLDASNSSNPVFKIESGTGKTYIGVGRPLSTGAASVAMLSVDGMILAKDIRVSVSTSTHWADYVFDKNYKLMPLNDVETFVQKNKHLPEVPSEAEVKKEGVDVTNMNVLLLKKVEELTLYMIDLKKENEQQKAQIEKLSEKVNGLSK